MTASSKATALYFYPTLLVTLLTLAMALAGCATLDQIVQKPTATFSGMKLVDASLVQSTANFHFSVHNPNPVNIRASRITYDLKLNGRHFVRGELDQGVTLAAGRTSPLAIPITIKYLDLYESLSRVLKSGRAQYALNGHFNIGPFAIPYQAQGSFDLPKMPRISLETINIQKISLSGATLNCRLRLDNPNDFALDFGRLDYHLKLGDTRLARASALSKGPIGQKERAVFNVDMAVSFTQMGLSAYQMLQGSKADFQMNGQLLIDSQTEGKRTIPFDLSGWVPFIR